jgi:Mg2+/citrate symporter
MNYIIPSIMLVALMYVTFTMANEYRKRKRVKNIQAFFEQKQRFYIEAKVRQTIEHKANWWDNFNIELYVKFLENR